MLVKGGALGAEEAELGIGAIEYGGDVLLLFNGRARKGELGEVGEVDANANAAVASACHKGFPHPGLAKMVEIGGQEAFGMTAKHDIITTHHDGFSSLPPGDGADVDSHGVVGEPISLDSLAAGERLSLHMVAHGHDTLSFRDSVEACRTHPSLVLIRNILSHIAQSDLLPLAFESEAPLSAGEEPLHESLLPTRLRFDQGVEFLSINFDKVA